MTTTPLHHTRTTEANAPVSNLDWVRSGVMLGGTAYAGIAVVFFFMGTGWAQVAQHAVVALACFAVLPISRRQPWRAGLVATGAIWGEVIFTLFSTTALDPSSMLVLPGLVVAAALLLGEFGATCWALATGVAVPLALWGGRQFGAMPPKPESPFVSVAVAEIALLASVLFARLIIAKFRRRHEETEQERRRFIQLFNQAPDCLVEVGPQQAVREVNAAAEQFFGARREQLIGRPLAELLVARGFPVAGALEATKPGVPLELESPTGPAGTRHLELTVSAAAETRQPYLVVIRDVSNQRRLAERQAEIQRLETVGRLAAGIAHDFNNLLTAIMGNASLLDLHADPEVRRHAGQINLAQQRGAKLTRQLLAFARHDMRQPELIILAQEMMEWTEIFRRMLGRECGLELKGEGGCVIEGDKVQIEQILLNLLANARDATAPGGTVTLAVARLHLPDATRLGSQLGAARQVMLAVTDRGAGMAPEVKRHLFEPFFTTKPPGKGTGMGLAATYGLVLQNGGSIVIESEVGQGTTARVFFAEFITASGGSHGVV